MKFLYFLDNDSGWAGLIFEDKNISLNYSISYCLGDNLTELLGGIIAFTGYKKQIKIIEDITEQHLDRNGMFEWIIDQEGSQIKFQFKKSKNLETINLKIIEICDEEKCIYEENINLNELIDNILFSCSEILRKYGIIGYSLNFWNEFPITYYLILVDYKKNEIKYDSFIEINNNRDQDMNRTSINNEIKYLLNEKNNI